MLCLATLALGASLAVAGGAAAAQQTATQAATPAAKSSKTELPPAAPTGLTVLLKTRTTITVYWQERDRVAGYDVYLDGKLVFVTPVRIFPFFGLKCGTSYLIEVAAVSDHRLRSARVGLHVTTAACADSTAPTAPTELSASAKTTSIDLSWKASSDNVGVVKYELFRDGAAAGTSTTTSFSFTGLTCGHSYQLEVDALDAAGHRSARSALTASTSDCADATPPSMPGDLKVTGTTSSSVSVSWTASTDNVGVVTYELTRDGSSAGSTTSTSATFSELPCGTSTTITVTAVDAAGNKSTPASVGATTSPCVRTADRFVSPTGSDYRWTHLAMTYDGTLLSLYVDGTLVSSAPVPGPVAGSTGPLHFGGDDPWGEWFSGRMDDVRIYSRALSPLDVVADMNAPVSNGSAAPDTTGLVAAYAFDGGAADVTGHGHDGTLEGAAALASGHSGGGLSLDGLTSRVTVPDDSELQLTTGMTLEAWVRPDRLGSAPADWRAAIYKESAPAAPDLAYALYAQSVESTYTGPSARIYTTSENSVHGPLPLPQNDCSSAAAPCLTLDRAYHAAIPGQVVELAGGNYGHQTIEPDLTKTGGPDVVFRPAVGATATGDDVVVHGASYLEIRGMQLGVWKTQQATDHVTFRDVTAGMFFVDSSSNISIIGGSYGPSTDFDNGQIRPACAGCPHSTGILIDGASFHDARLSPGSVDHVECLQIWGTDHLTIRNSRFRDCEQHDVFFSGEGEPVSDVTFEQNFAGPVLTGFYSLRITASDPTEGCKNILFRYNSTGSPIGLTCGPAAVNVRLVGNVGPLGTGLCDSRYDYSHNVWEGAFCGPTDLNAPSNFVDPASNDLHLKPGAVAIDNGDPADYPAKDIDGKTRPVGAGPDAGASESG